MSAAAKENKSVADALQRSVDTALQLMRLDLAGVAVSSGAACSSGKVGKSHVLDAMGVSPELSRGAVRISLGWTTTEQDITRFIAALNKLKVRRNARAAA